jgi:hypothetical protein
MSQPTPYARQFDFTGWSTSRPNTPHPGVQIDAELNAVRAALNHALTNLALIQRDDTGLANGVVGIDQLSAVVQAMLAGGGFTVRGNWAAATAYLRGDVVSDSGKVYLVITDHNSSASLAADIASGYVSSALFEPHALLDYMDDLAAATGAGLVGSTGGITVQAALDLKAALASPTFTGTPAAPTAALGTDTTQIATTAFVQDAVQALLDAAPGTLDTLNELAAALGDDANFAATMTAALAGKAASADLAASGGSALVGFLQAGSGATAKTVQAKLRDVVSVFDFGATGDGVANDGAAINLALATGKDVYIPAGYVFDIDGVTLLPTANQRIFGGGRLKKTTTATDIALSGSQDAPRFIKILSLSNVVVEDVEFEYTGTVTPRVYAVTIEASNNCVVRNCKFLGTETPCFVWKNSDGTVFEGNLTSGGVFGIATGGDAAGNTNGAVTNTLIRGNYFSGAISEGVDINWDTQGCIIDGNFLIGNNTTAGEEDIDIGGGTCSDIIVSNNVLDSGGLSIRGIIVKLNTSNVKINNNIILNGINDTTSTGVYITGNDGTSPVTDIDVSNNKIDGFNKGVVAGYGATRVRIAGNNISGLRAAASSYGVEVIGTSATNSTVVNNVDILDNHINGEGLATGAGVQIDDCLGFRVSGNRITDMGADGILLLSPAAGGQVTDNYITACDDGMVTLATDVVISRNRIYENDKHGLNIQGDRTTVTDNIIYNNANTAASDGIVLTAGADYAIIIGNNIFDNQGTPTQRYGINVTGACDRCIINGNILYANATGATNGTGSLTNSLLGAAGNITA